MLFLLSSVMQNLATEDNPQESWKKTWIGSTLDTLKAQGTFLSLYCVICVAIG